MSIGVFISYRRADSAGYAHALASRLIQEFGPNSVFMDVDSLEPGIDFVETIDNSLSSCSVLLALIGNQWLGAKEGSVPRIKNDNDYVRIELAYALSRDVRVIPILIDEAQMPSEMILPNDLQPLVRRQAIEWSSTRFNFDLDRIIDAVKKTVRAYVAIPPAIENETRRDHDSHDAGVAIEKKQDHVPKNKKENLPDESHPAELKRVKPAKKPNHTRLLARMLGCLVLATLLGIAVFYFSAITTRNREIPLIAGAAGFILSLIVTGKCTSFARSIFRLVILGAALFISFFFITNNFNVKNIINDIFSSNSISVDQYQPPPSHRTGQQNRLEARISASSTFFQPLICNQSDIVDLTISITSLGRAVPDALVSQTRAAACDPASGKTDSNGIFRTRCNVPTCTQQCATQGQSCPCTKFGINWFWQASKAGYIPTGEVNMNQYTTVDCLYPKG